MKKKYILLSLFSCLCSYVGIASATLDYKQLPASACEWQSIYWGQQTTLGPAVGQTVHQEYHTNADGIITSAAPASHVFVGITCPIIRDQTTILTSSMVVYLEVVDTTPTTAISCSYSMIAPDGSIGITSTVGGDSGVSFAGGAKELGLTGITSSVNGGVYSVDCQMPVNTKLVGYVWGESTTTDTN